MFVIGYYYSFVIIINCIIVNYLRIAASGEVIKILYCIVLYCIEALIFKMATTWFFDVFEERNKWKKM